MAPLNGAISQSAAAVAAAVSTTALGSSFVQEQKETCVCTNDFVLWFSDLAPLVYIRGSCLIRTG